MIHFFPELAALYHRSLIVSLDKSNKARMWDEWTQELWRFSPDKNSYYAHKPSESKGPLSGFFAANLGKRNKDNQKIVGFCSSVEEIQKNDSCLECADSILIEVEPESESTNALFKWHPGPVFMSKKVLWCMRSPLSHDGTLHEKALDKKLAELSPDSHRILWPKGQFIRDGLEWVLSF
ncbi:MAG: hypothetical protein R3A80_01080 [Bdellovibrionota bacterium]